MIRSDYSLLVFSPTKSFFGEFAFKQGRFCSAFLTEAGFGAIGSLLDLWQAFGIPEILFSDQGCVTLEQRIPLTSRYALPASRDALQGCGFSLISLSASVADVWHQTDNLPFLSEERFALAETLSRQEVSVLADWKKAFQALQESMD